MDGFFIMSAPYAIIRLFSTIISPTKNSPLMEAIVSPARDSSANQRIVRIVLWLVVIFALAFFFYRAPYRAFFHRGGDLASPYVAGWRFYKGVSPYPQRGFIAFWHSRGAPQSAQLSQSDSTPIYPPSTLVLMGSLCLLPWRTALFLYVAVCAALYILLLVRLSKYLSSNTVRLAFIAYGLMFSPILAGMGTANLSILSFILVAFAFLFVRTKPVNAGVLIALATCLKPTIGAPAIALLLFFRCWTELVCSTLITGAIWAFALFRLRSVPGWREDYAGNVAYLFGPTGAASYFSSNSSRFDLLNLQVPVYGFTHSFLLTNVFCYGLAVVLLAWWAWKFLPAQQLDWASISSLCMIALLSYYQRNYCAGFVLLAVLWAANNVSESLQARLVLLLAVIFLFPGEALLRTYSSHLPSFLLGRAGQNLLFAQATWAIAAMTVLILVSRERATALSVSEDLPQRRPETQVSAESLRRVATQSGSASHGLA
jgi:hypothetical protein